MSKKSQSPNQPQHPPRQLGPIQDEYNQTCAKAGNVQYQISTLTQELSTLNRQLRSLNQEGFNRMALDKKAGTPAQQVEAQVELPKTEETAAVENV